jgi:predicted O-methyltransferase YrrM
MLEELLKDVPLIHASGTRSYRIHDDLVSFLEACLQPNHVTLETGSGVSTIVFLYKRVKRHFAIQPNSEEFQIIRDFCHQYDLDTSAAHMVVARSQDYLPTALLPDLDVVLIDGDHSFPIPFMDWYYTADRLRVGGLMVIDDTNIATGTILADFMHSDPKWHELVRHDSGRFAIYRKISHPIHEGLWQNQPYLHRFFPTASVTMTRERSQIRLKPIALQLLPRSIKTLIRAAVEMRRR